MTLTVQNLNYIQQFLKTRSGFILKNEKAYLLDSHLLHLVKRYDAPDVNGLIDRLRMQTGTLPEEVLEAMTIHETSFFRDKKPFDHLRANILPALVQRLSAGEITNPIRIWSAASSSGQEAYSLAIMLHEYMHVCPQIKVEIIGTDIDSQIVEKAAKGLYTQFEVQRGLPAPQLVKYFSQVGEEWQLSEQLRAMVSFRTFNLLQSPLALGTFDIVFCRNVLIYFDDDTRLRVLGHITQALRPKGVVYLGASETTLPAGAPLKFYGTSSEPVFTR